MTGRTSLTQWEDSAPPRHAERESSSDSSLNDTEDGNADPEEPETKKQQSEQGAGRVKCERLRTFEKGASVVLGEEFLGVCCGTEE